MSNFNEAVQSLASGIKSKKNSLNKQEKLNLSRKLLKHSNPENHNKWSEIEINLDPNHIQNLQSYQSNLQEAYNEEIGKNIQSTLQKVEDTTNLRNRLQQELNQALNETKELEKIAKRLQDEGIGKIAGKEEDQVNKLGEDLGRINQEGKELEKDKQKIIQILSDHNLEQSDLHEELGKRASAVEKVLQASSSGASRGGSNTDLNQIAQRIIQKESKLQEAEDRGLQQLEDNIKTLSRIVELEEQEVSALRQLNKLITQGNLDDANDLLEKLVEKREEFGENSEHLKRVRYDIEEEKNLVIALSSFFQSLENLENANITRSKLFQKLASEGPFSSPQKAKSFVESLEGEFKQIEGDIRRLEKLEGKERKLEDLEYQKIREIDQKDSKLRENADSIQEKQKIKGIHDKLHQLDYDLQKQVIAYDWDDGEHGDTLDTWDEMENFDKASADNMQDWKPVLAHPEDHINLRNKISNISDKNITFYDISDEFDTFSYPDPKPRYKTPRQGFKIHITAYPHEGYQVCKELIPIVQKLGYRHKIMTDINNMRKYMKSDGSYGSVQGMKLFTIYPGLTNDAPKEQDFKSGDIDHNEDRFFINQEMTVNLLEKLLDYADDSILQGGPELKGPRDRYGVKNLSVKEYQVKNTRIHVTYSLIGNMTRYIKDSNGNKESVEDWVREENNNGKHYNFRESGSFDKNGSYSNSDYFLSHLISENESSEIIDNLVNGYGMSVDANDAIIGLDGKVAGAYYLPPPEGIQRIEKIISNL